MKLLFGLVQRAAARIVDETLFSLQRGDVLESQPSLRLLQADLLKQGAAACRLQPEDRLDVAETEHPLADTCQRQQQQQQQQSQKKKQATPLNHDNLAMHT